MGRKLINSDGFTMDAEAGRALGQTDDPVVGWTCSGTRDQFYNRADDLLRWSQNFPIQGLKGPDGIGYTTNYGAYGGRMVGFVVTDACQYPDVAVRMVDWTLDMEHNLNGTQGPKGEYWDDPDPGEIGINGEPALYKLLKAYHVDDEPNSAWFGKLPALRDDRIRLGEQATGYKDIMRYLETKTREDAEIAITYASFNEVVNYAFYQHTVQDALPEEYQLPPLLFDEADSQRIAELKAVLEPHLIQVYSEFITGNRSLDTFDAYVSEMEGMGALELTEIYNRRLAEQYPEMA